MKSFTYFLRRTHPMLILGFIYVMTAIIFLKKSLNTDDPMWNFLANWLIFIVCSMVFIISTFICLNKLTQGKAELASGYKANVGVSVFGGSRTRWEGCFETKFGAVFSALYRAWYLDHFGNVNYEFGVVYGVRSI
jgi:hypothetical protein